LHDEDNGHERRGSKQEGLAVAAAAAAAAM